MAEISDGGGSSSSMSWLAKTAPKKSLAKMTGSGVNGSGGNGGVVYIPPESLDPSKTKLVISPSGVLNIPSGSVSRESISPSGFGSNLLTKAGKPNWLLQNPITKSIAESEFGQYLMRLFSPTGGKPVTEPISAVMQVLSPTGPYTVPASSYQGYTNAPASKTPQKSVAGQTIWMPTDNPLNYFTTPEALGIIPRASTDKSGSDWIDYWYGGGGGGGYSDYNYTQQVGDYFQQLMNWSI